MGEVIKLKSSLSVEENNNELIESTRLLQGNNILINKQAIIIK